MPFNRSASASPNGLNSNHGSSPYMPKRKKPISGTPKAPAESTIRAWPMNLKTAFPHPTKMSRKLKRPSIYLILSQKPARQLGST